MDRLLAMSLAFFKKLRRKRKSNAEAMVQLPDDQPEELIDVAMTSANKLPSGLGSIGKLELLEIRRESIPAPRVNRTGDDALDGRETDAMVDRLSAATKFAIAREKVRKTNAVKKVEVR